MIRYRSKKHHIKTSKLKYQFLFIGFSITDTSILYICIDRRVSTLIFQSNILQSRIFRVLFYYFCGATIKQRTSTLDWKRDVLYETYFPASCRHSWRKATIHNAWRYVHPPTRTRLIPLSHSKKYSLAHASTHYQILIRRRIVRKTIGLMGNSSQRNRWNEVVASKVRRARFSAITCFPRMKATANDLTPINSRWNILRLSHQISVEKDLAQEMHSRPMSSRMLFAQKRIVSNCDAKN